MTKRAPVHVALVILLFFVCGTLSAQDESNDLFADSPFHAEMSGQIHFSGFGVYGSVNPSVTFKLWWFGAGLGTKFYTGLSQQDLYIAPYFRLEILWFYLGGGYSFPLLHPGGAFFNAEMGPFVTAGISTAPIAFAFGRLGFDLTLDAVATALTMDISGIGFPTTWEAVLVYLWLNLKAGIGLTYTFPL